MDGAAGAGGDAIGDTIGAMFEIPEANLDGQLVEMTSTEVTTASSSQKQIHEKDDMGDAVGDLLDVI